VSGQANFANRLDGYVEVKDRIALFYEKHPDGRLVTTEVRATSEPDGVPRVWVEAAAYRTPDDPHPGKGWSWLILPGSTSFTRGSEIENAETSAWGRAIGALGIGINKSIASSDEIASKEGESARPTTPRPAPLPGGASTSWDGKVTTTATADGSVRKDRDRGEFAAFKLELEQPEQGFRSAQVRFWGDLAHALATAILSNGMPDVATVWGDTEVAHFTDKATKRQVNYLVINATRVMTPEWTMPAAEPEAPVPAEPNDIDDLPW
jgi:hypothetical protein